MQRVYVFTSLSSIMVLIVLIFVFHLYNIFVKNGDINRLSAPVMLNYAALGLDEAHTHKARAKYTGNRNKK